jgi:hypothetical protein
MGCHLPSSGLTPTSPPRPLPAGDPQLQERSTPVSRRALRGHSVNEDHRTPSCTCTRRTRCPPPEPAPGATAAPPPRAARGAQARHAAWRKGARVLGGAVPGTDKGLQPTVRKMPTCRSRWMLGAEEMAGWQQSPSPRVHGRHLRARHGPREALQLRAMGAGRKAGLHVTRLRDPLCRDPAATCLKQGRPPLRAAFQQCSVELQRLVCALAGPVTTPTRVAQADTGRAGPQMSCSAGSAALAQSPAGSSPAAAWLRPAACARCGRRPARVGSLTLWFICAVSRGSLLPHLTVVSTVASPSSRHTQPEATQSRCN